MQIFGICRKVWHYVVLAVMLMAFLGIWKGYGSLTVMAAEGQQIDLGSDRNITSRIGQKNYPYQPDGVRPDPALYYGETALIKGKDFTVEYKNNNSVGTATAIVTGTGAYSGQMSLCYEIVPLELKTASITMDASPVEYTGKKVTFPDLTATLFYVAGNREKLYSLVEGQDFRIVGYGDNIGPGTAKMTVGGLGNYTGIATATFTIYRQNDVSDQNNLGEDIAGAELMYSDIQSYTGHPVEPEVIVTFNGRELEKDFDYKMTFSNNTKPGTATITITGIGAYRGEKTAVFEIIED